MLHLDSLVTQLVFVLTSEVSKREVYVRSSLLLYREGKGTFKIGCGTPGRLLPLWIASCASSCGIAWMVQQVTGAAVGFEKWYGNKMLPTIHTHIHMLVVF